MSHIYHAVLHHIQPSCGRRRENNVMSSTIPIHGDADAIQRVDTSVYLGQESRKELEICVNVERMTLTFTNLHVVQVGKSNELVNDVEPCHNHRRKRRQVAREDEILKENSTPDEAASIAEFNSTFSIKAFDEGQSTLSTKDLTTLKEFQHNKMKIEEVVDLEYGIPLIRKQGSITGVKCETIMTKLEVLQDNGQFEAHEKYACAILESSSTRDDSDMRAILMIERGMAFYYANDLKKCKQHFKVAIRMGNSLVNRELLEARALFLKSAAYRRERKFNKALQCLQQAEFLLSHHESGEDRGELYYNYGTLWLDMYSTTASNNLGREVFREKAKKCFENAIEHGARDTRLRVQLKKKRYYNIRVAALHLDCSSKAARNTQRVRNEDVEEARKRLDFVEYQLSDGMPLGTKVQLLRARSDQHYRQGNVRLARKVAEEGLKIAEKLEKNSSIGMLRERIEELKAMEDAWLHNTESVITYMSDSGFSGDCSSSN